MNQEGTPFGRYRLIELIGRGGMGEVWRSYDTETQRVVAVKVLTSNMANDPTFVERFRREALAAAGLNDPHVIPIHNFGEIDGRLYVDMRLIKGRDLETIIAEGVMEPGRAVTVIEQIASALHDAHQIGLVHRDVKPSNILVTDRDFAYLIDFGIASAAGESRMTNTGSVIGTWAYMAPERLSKGQADPRSDTYALACVLHECLTGSQPFPGTSLEQQIGGHLAMPAPRPSTLRRGLPPQLDGVIEVAMAKNPDQRYSTVTEMAAAARSAITQPMMPVTHPRGGGPVESDTQVVAIRPSVPQNSYPARSAGDTSDTDATQYRQYGPPVGAAGPGGPGGASNLPLATPADSATSRRTGRPRAKLPTGSQTSSDHPGKQHRGGSRGHRSHRRLCFERVRRHTYPCDYGGWGEQWPLDRHLHADLRQEHRPDGRGRAGTGAARYRDVEIALGVCKQGVRGYRGEKHRGVQAPDELSARRHQRTLDRCRSGYGAMRQRRHRRVALDLPAPSSGRDDVRGMDRRFRQVLQQTKRASPNG